jgi:hypothetical protein
MKIPQNYISAIEATGGWERFDKIMYGLARSGHSMRMLDKYPEKAASLDFRITNYIRTCDYRSWRKRRGIFNQQIPN